MAGPGLPVGIDSTYADSSTDPSVKAHQQAHDTVHSVVNKFDQAAPADGQVLVWNAATSLWTPGSPAGGNYAPTASPTFTGTVTLPASLVIPDGAIAQQDVTGLVTDLGSKANASAVQQVVRWSGSAWPARPAGAAFGVVFLSTNDPAATAPPTTGLLVGDVWARHPDAP